MTGRVLAVDPGEKRIGIALSDPTATLAAPLAIIQHVQMMEDCRKIIQMATEHDVVLIIVGQALGAEGEETRQARHAKRIAETLAAMSSISVELWDESGSTRDARQVRIEMGVNRKERSGHMDDRAAAMFLQSYLDRNSRQERS